MHVGALFSLFLSRSCIAVHQPTCFLAMQLNSPLPHVHGAVICALRFGGLREPSKISSSSSYQLLSTVGCSGQTKVCEARNKKKTKHPLDKRVALFRRAPSLQELVL